MDKQLLKAYIRTIVEEEVKRVLPELLGEAVAQIKKGQVNEAAPAQPRKPVDRARLAQLMEIDYDGDTLSVGRPRRPMGGEIEAGQETSVDDFVNKDWSKFKF